MQLLYRIERHLRRSGTPATKFGREAVHDPRFVFDLRKGRQLRSRTAGRVAAYLDMLEQNG
jgi:2,4-dienoyl-CoA reductase-like NADH-dependent reductase (Old Yellow Enzyme family)